MEKKIVTFGEIMLRLATPGYLRFGQGPQFNASFGGGEANVAVSLANYGMEAEFITRLPDNDIARACVMDLHKYNVGTGHILYGGERMGIYFWETGSVARAGKVMYDRAHSSIDDIRPGMVDWREVFKDAKWFHWTGILPALSEGAADACREAIQTANQMGVTVSCDLNYRENLWKGGKKAADVMQPLVEGCDIVLGNDDDCLGTFGIKADNLEGVCLQMQSRFPGAKKTVAMERRSINANHCTWKGFMSAEGKLYSSRQYDITHIVDCVGVGDAFMGGLIYGLNAYPADDQKALDFAVAASCLKHTIYGDYNQVTVEEVEKLMSGDASGRVSR